MLSLSRMLNRGVMPIALLLGVLASAGIVLAATSHGTTSGGHTAGSHSYNQTHMWISVGADHGGTISSGARFHDGPLAIIPGGPLRAGQWVETPISDWRFATDLDVLELQLESQSTSRTTWILVRAR